MIFVSRFWLVIIYWIVNIFALLYIWPTLNKLNNNNNNNNNNNRARTAAAIPAGDQRTQTPLSWTRTLGGKIKNTYTTATNTRRVGKSQFSSAMSDEPTAHRDRLNNDSSPNFANFKPWENTIGGKKPVHLIYMIFNVASSKSVKNLSTEKISQQHWLKEIFWDK